MTLTTKWKTVILRGIRSAAAVAVASLAAYVTGPEVTALIPAGYQFLVVGAVVPSLLALEKWLRYGGDPGESSGASSTKPSTD